MNPRLLKCVLALTVLSAATAYASNVRTDYDHNVSFANYKTFSWGKIDTSNPLNEDRAKADIQKDLESKRVAACSIGGRRNRCRARQSPQRERARDHV